jgi:apolipoprotein D and lipocalin family protein
MDLTRVPGDWYLAARYPTIFDRVAVSGKVTLTATNFVDMDVKWSFLKSPDASERSTWNLELSAGTGKNTTLWSLSPVWPLKATVYVVEMSGDYSWLVLGSPDRRLLWILTKKEQEDPLLIAGLIERLGQNGFDTTAIVVEKPKD